MSQRQIEHWIDGGSHAGSSGRTQPVNNPATGQASAQLCMGGPEELQAAVSAAKAAGRQWAEASMAKRMAVLFAFRHLISTHRDELAQLITAEHGKVLSDAAGEVARGLEVVDYACGMPELLKGDHSDQVAAGIDVFSYRQPVGVVAGITPFNFPAMIPLWMSPMAIATGNAFILKPSERDPSVAVRIAQLWQEAGLPDGVFQVLHGDKEMVDGLLTHDDVDAISFVGSTPIAQYVHRTATAHGKRVQAMGGAKNHAVIMPDADLDLAADHLSAAAYGSAGERCMAISVAVAVGDAAEGLAQRVGERARAIVVGEGTQEGAEMGPLITAAAKERVERIIGEAEQAGAQVHLDGRGLTVEGCEDGFFVGPTILDRVERDMSAYTEEIFGPVLVIVRAADLEEAIEIINANPYGNGTAIFTGSGAAARTFHRRVTVGMVGVNVPVPVPVAWHSFGGWKDSLFGEHHMYGRDGVRFYTRAKAITQRWPEVNDHSGASLDFPAQQD